MEESTSDFRGALLDLIDGSPEPVDHPSADHWLAYQRGELADDEEALLQEHLARCRDCFDLAEAAASFVAVEEEPGTGREVGAAAVWRLLRPQLGLPPDPPRQSGREIPAGPRRRPSWRTRLPMTLAASFFLALVGLAAWHFRPQAPQPNVHIVDFAGGERNSAAEERVLSAATGPWMLVFHPAIEIPAYRLALLDAASGRQLWSYELQPDEDNALTILLRERPGRYRIELSDGFGGRAGKVLETHFLRVTAPGQKE